MITEKVIERQNGEIVGVAYSGNPAGAAACQEAIRRAFGNVETWTYNYGSKLQVGFVTKSDAAFQAISYFGQGFQAGRKA
jgi:hypothetical protein